MSSPKGNIRACWDAYKKGADEVRDKPVKQGDNVGLCVAIYVADTMEQAAKDIRPAINLYYELLSGVRPSGEWMKKAYLGKDEELSAEDAQSDWFDFLMSRGIIWVGTADYVADRIAEFRDDVNVHHIMLLQQYPGIAYEKILASMSKFASHVMPRFE